MEALIHCPGCQNSVSVPGGAAGHVVLCPACGKKFTAPSGQDLLEETFSAWIEQDVEEVLADRHRRIDQKLQRPQPSRDADRNKTAGNASDPAIQRPHKQKTTTPQEASPGDTHLSKSSRDVEPQTPQERCEISSDGKSQRAPDTIATRKQKSRSDTSDETKVQYPSDLFGCDAQPHLVVKQTDHSGVRFAFDSQWLSEEGFRAAMPMRCVFSSNSDRTSLIARPLIFMDRIKSQKTSLDNIVAAHQNRVLADRSPRQIIKAMGRIESLPTPFDQPMPYYVNNKFAHLSLHCQTHDRSDGGITCEVLVPEAMCALDWLARVNGVCGKAYELLERDASMLHGEAWRKLSEPTQQRITTWCKLRPREELRLYIADADFGKRDQGLAGVVITDQRLVFCKYHHRGQVRRDTSNAAVMAKVDHKFAILTLVVGSQRSRMVKIHCEDMDSLTRELGHVNNGLKVVVT